MEWFRKPLKITLKLGVEKRDENISLEIYLIYVVLILTKTFLLR